MSWQEQVALLSADDPVERWLRAAVAAGGIAMTLGAVLPWVDTITIGGGSSVSGTEFFAGKIVLILGIASLLGATFRVPLAIAFVLGGSAGVIEAAWVVGNLDLFRLAREANDIGWQPQIGFMISVLGASLAALGGFISVFPGGGGPR